MHCALAKTSRPFTASPVFPSFSVRKDSNSSYLYFETTGLPPATSGSGASFGNV